MFLRSHAPEERRASCDNGAGCSEFSGGGGAAVGDLGDGALPLTTVSSLVTLSSTPGPETTVNITPCFFPGVLTIHVTGTDSLTMPVPSNASACNTTTNTISFQLPFVVAPTDAVTVSDVTAGRLNGDLNAAAPVGEVDAGGPARCAADLTAQAVTCTNLVPGASGYTFTDGAQQVSGTADIDGTLSESLRLRGGDSVALTNASQVLLTTLHVAPLRLDTDDASRSFTGGTCQGNEWFGTLTDNPSPPAAPSLCQLNGTAGAW